MRGKDKQKRKCDKYSEAIRKRYLDKDYVKKAKLLAAKAVAAKMHLPADFNLYDIQTLKSKLSAMKWTQGTPAIIQLDKDMYGSLFYHTEPLQYTGKISERYYIIMYDESCFCDACGYKRNFISVKSGYSGCRNRKCEKYQKTGFGSIKTKLTDEEFAKYYKEHIACSKERFMHKYGDEWEKKWNDFKAKQSSDAKNRLKNRKEIKASKAANKFFSTLNDLGFDGQFALNGGEKRMVLIDGTIIFVDYILDNLIIEYDGDYWHEMNKDRDVKRDRQLSEIGFKILRISHARTIKSFNESIQLASDFLTVKK